LLNLNTNMEDKIVFCEIHVDYKDKMGFNAGHSQCSNKAKFSINFYDVILKRDVSYNMCGVHKAAFLKNQARVNKLTNRNTTALIKEI